MITPEIAARAHAQVERPGLWWERWDGVGEDCGAQGDGRVLSQDETDTTIVEELILRVRNDLDFVTFTLPWRSREFVLWTRDTIPRSACAQRGGIHSDPLVRAYALATWGERDVAWHEQPICSCGHEADLHPVTTPRWSWSAKAGERSRMQIGQRQHRCETRDIVHDECPCTYSRERVRELSGPTCTCAFTGIPNSRGIRTNGGGAQDFGLRHQPKCEKLAWYRKSRLDAAETAFFARQLATLCGNVHLALGPCALESGHDGEHEYRLPQAR